MAGKYSLNFKVLRGIRKDLARLSRFIYGNVVLLENVFLSSDLSYTLTQRMRSFFAYRSGHFGIVPFYRQMRAPEDLMWIDERSITTLKYNVYKLSPGSRLDPFHVRKQTFIPLSESQNGSSVRLWTLSPTDYRDRPGFLYQHMCKKRSEMDERQTYRVMFDECVLEIKDEVAYRPGMYKMLDAQHHFISTLSTLESL